MEDELIGKTVVIPEANHGGHTLTVEAYGVRLPSGNTLPQAYLCRCSCGAPFVIGAHWTRRAIEQGEYRLYDKPWQADSSGATALNDTNGRAETAGKEDHERSR